MRLFDYAGSGNAYKVRLLLAQLEQPYERVHVDIAAGASRTADFLATKNLAGRVPVLELDDGTALPESNAILWHLARGSRFFPEAPLDQSKVLQWMFFEQSEIEPILGSARYWILTGRDRERADELARRIEIGRASLAAMNRHLESRAFFVAERYTIADVALYAYAHVAGDARIDLAAYPAVRAWIARVESQPRWFAGPDAYGANARVT
jgi:glutathione S-transferase